MEKIMVNNLIDSVAVDKSIFKKPLKPKQVVLTAVKYFLLVLFSLFFIFPFFIMICYSLLPDNEALSQVLFSKQGIVNLGTYVSILSNKVYLGYLKNTVITSLLAAVGIPLSSSLCAYSFAKLKYKGQNVLFAIVLATLMIPGIVVQIPLYTIYVNLGWANTLLPLWVPAFFGGGATNIFLMTQFMRGIPNDIAAAAKIDGANSFTVYLRFVIPLCLPVLLYVMVTGFMGSWNDFMTPLLYITDRTKATFSLGLYWDYGGDIGPNNLPNSAMAAGIVMMLPCLILFFVFQKSLIEGVSITGLKG